MYSIDPLEKSPRFAQHRHVSIAYPCANRQKRLESRGEIMNWRLLLYLSLFGFVMAIATISFLPQTFEYIVWPFIFCFCAYTISKNCNDRLFVHGFMLSIINCIYIVAFHSAFFETYAAAHDAAIAAPQGPSPRAMSAAFGVVAGIISGVVQGAFCIIAGKLRSKTQAA